MASGSTNNFCYKINQELGDENPLALYCKENGNMLLLDPNGAIPFNSVNQEDLVIYATLKARVRNKSLIIDNQTENTTTINFIKGKDAGPGQAPEGSTFLTTNWTNVGSVDSQLGEDLETFGMTNIDINFNSGFIPIITIDFVDIRGATLFEQGSCSPYGAFFHQPYPIFDLTVKGYYGQPVKYYLNCQKFTTSFDPGTGNYKSRGEFIGYSYAFLSDILLGYIMAAPYMEDYDSDAKLVKIYEKYLEYFKELGYNEGPNKFNPIVNKDGRPFTVYNYVKKVEGLIGQANSDEGAIAEIQNSSELSEIDNLDNIQQTINDIENLLEDFKADWEEDGGTANDDIYTFGQSNTDINSPRAEVILTTYNKYFSQTGSIGVRVTVFNELVGQVTSQTKLTNLEAADFSLTSDDDNLYILDLKSFRGRLESKTREITTSLNSKRDEFKRLANEKVKGSIGFVPTIRSFFTVLLANTELFLELLKDASHDAEVYHENNPDQSLDFKQFKDGNAPPVGGPNGVVWAWPTYVERKKVGGKEVETDVETYPGNNPKFANWPEVKFVEDFLKALQEMQKDISEEEDEEEDLTIDPYDDIPGRDNYLAINAMETPAGARDCNNSYYNLNGTDDVFKALGERFIILSNFSSVNSNNLNTSILATARNKFFEWHNQSGPGNKQHTSFDGNPSEGISNNIEYLNNSTLTPYFSAGIPFNPPVFGGEDSGLYTSLTYSSEYKKTSNRLGYPYIDWATVGNGVPKPYGVAGSAGGYSIRKDVGGTFNPEILENIDTGGEVQSFTDTTTETLSKSIDLRTVYYDARFTSAQPNGRVIINSPFNEKIANGGNKAFFILSEPIYYTRTVIFMWAGLESISSRGSQFEQIPKEVRDRCFIVLAAGTTQDEQNTYEELEDAFINYYSELGADISLRSTVLNEPDEITPLDIPNEFSNFQKMYLGYSEGGYALFNNSEVNSGKIIGLIDPAIKTTNSNDLTDGNKWTSASRMIWGNSDMISTFNETNYQALNDTIKNTGGKSEKINALNHTTAIQTWFEKYKDDVLDGLLNVNDTIVSIQVTPPTPETETTSVTNSRAGVTTAFSPTPGGPYTLNTPITISRPQSNNWEWLGRTEAHNFYNSISNIPLIGQIINFTNSTEELYDKIIELLDIPEDDIFKDFHNESYRYDKSLTLNKVAKKNGGIVNIFPDIHKMSGEDLVRLNLFTDVRNKGLNFTNKADTPSDIMDLWYQNNSGRKGFGIKKESTFIKAIDLNDYIDSKYGNTIEGERQVGGKNKENNKTITAERRLVILRDQNYTSTRLSNANYVTNAQLETGEFAEAGSMQDTGLYITSYGPVVDGYRFDIDLSRDEYASPALSKHSNTSAAITDKFLTLDIYPDYEFYYVGWPTMVPPKKYAGFPNYRYSRDYYEFTNNTSNNYLRKDSTDNQDGSPFLNWHALDLGSLPGLISFSKSNMNILRTNNLLGDKDNPYSGVEALFAELGKGDSILSYATAYTDKVVSPKKVSSGLSNIAGDFPSFSPTNGAAVRISTETDLFVYNSTDVPNLDEFLKNNVYDADAGKFVPKSGTNPNLQTLRKNDAGIPIISVGNSSNDPNFVPLSDEEFEKQQKEREEKEKKARELSEAKKNSLSLLTIYPEYTSDNTINMDRFGLRVQELNNNLDAQKNDNSNWLNVGGTITETPWWRHNFPASENDSNISKSYYSFYGAGVMNSADSIDYKNAGLCSKPLYMGLKNDLDSYNLSSKFFPDGLGNDFYGGERNDEGQKTGVKIMLTNHNEDDVEIVVNPLDNEKIVNNFTTNYNRTKAWKGSLAYLFLSNQYHKPWTGQQSNSLRSLGPQGTLGLASMNSPMPRHSVLMLGAVLWRMREAGLLLSDDDKWDLAPQITDGLDPVCYPKLPNKMSWGGYDYDTVHFTKTPNEGGLSASDTTYPTNRGVRPPQLSIITAMNRQRASNNSGKSDYSVLCFPRADEWPTPNVGMIYAYDFFGDKKIENPFRNQYKIWTPFFAKRNLLGLRYVTQQLMYSTTKNQVEALQNRVTAAYNAQTSDLEDYSDSAKASISEDLGNFAENYLNEQINNANENTKSSSTLDHYAELPNIAGSEEGFTRLTTIAHQLNRSFVRVDRILGNLTDAGLIDRNDNTFIKELYTDNLNVDDGRNTSLVDISLYGNIYGGGLTSQSITNIQGSAQSSNSALSENGALYKGPADLDSEYIKKYGVEIRVNTWEEMEKLLKENVFVKPDGETINIKRVLAEVLPEAEYESRVNIVNTDFIYYAIDNDGKPVQKDLYLFQAQTQSQVGNNAIAINVQGSQQANQNIPPTKSFTSIVGPVNIHVIRPTNLDSSITPESSPGSFGLALIPQINEINGYVLPTGFDPNNNQYNSSFIANKYSENYGATYGYKDKESIKTALKIITATNTYNEISSSQIPTEAELEKNIYHFVGNYKRFNDTNDVVYNITGIEQGIQFVVLPNSAPEVNPNSVDENTDIDEFNQNLGQQISEEEKENSTKLKTPFSNIGYLNGYLPIGPELWFMPTSVKQIFIKEFEDFVGDFNNFTDASDFDSILKLIDPLNFPKPEKTNRIPGVFENEITYPTMFEEVGSYVNRAPYILRIENELNQDLYAKGLEMDELGFPRLPDPLRRWVNFYQFGTGVKSIQNTSDLNNEPNVTTVREMKTPPVTFQKKATTEDVDKTDDGVVTEKKAGEGGDEVSASKSIEIWDKLFGSYYILSSSTPRTWWGEFPLDKDGKETTNDYFRFGKQELFSYLKGFLEELNKPTIKNDYVEKIKSEYLTELTSEALGASQDDDIRLTIYRSLKSIYDRWISASPAGKNKDSGDNLFFNPIGEGRILMDHFSFVNRVNEDIGDKALVNIDIVNELFLNTRNSIYGVTSDILDGSNFNFFPLPTYVDLSAGVSLFTKTNTKGPNNRQQAVRDMFRPISDQEYFSELALNSSGPHFLCQYVGGYSKELELSKNKEKGCLDEQTKRYGRLENRGDSFGLSNVEETPPDFTEERESSNGVVGFKVRFGSEKQSHFLGVNLDQAEYKNTQEALLAMDKIANAATDGGSGGFIAKGQSLYEVFLNRSYSCTVEALGNPMIQPLMYFELENVPMFYGSYLIRDVKHNIRPHSMKTTFTGDRIPYAVVPVVEDLISSFKIKPVQSGEKKSLKTGGSSSPVKYEPGTPGKPIDLDVIPASTDTAAITLGLKQKEFELVPYYTKNGKLLNTEYGKGSGKAFVRDKYQPVGITLHWCACWRTADAHSTLRSRGNGTTYNLSYHIEVGEDGKPYQFADLNRSAAHGGCPSDKGPRCKDMNQVVPTIAVSYVGGVEEDGKHGYYRTWEEWQSEDLTKDGGKHNFKSKAQWEGIVDSILYAKAYWPSIKFITSHHWSDGGKIDVGNKFPWDKLLNALKAGGWNKASAGADPYLVTEWVGKNGKIIRDNKLELSAENADYIIESEDLAEYTATNNTNDRSDNTASKSYRETTGCKLVNIPEESKKFTSAQIDAKIKEVEPSYNKAIRAGIIGNMFQESSFNINAYGRDGAVCGSYGLVQWRSSKPGKDRQDKFAEYCESNNLKTDSLEGQIQWLIKGELQGSEKRRTKELLAVPDSAEGAKQAALWFAKNVERCGGCMDATLAKPGEKITKRQIYAEDIYNGTFKY